MFIAMELTPFGDAAFRYGLGAVQWPMHALLALELVPLRPVAHVADAEDLWTLPALWLAFEVGTRRARSYERKRPEGEAQSTRFSPQLLNAVAPRKYVKMPNSRSTVASAVWSLVAAITLSFGWLLPTTCRADSLGFELPSTCDEPVLKANPTLDAPHPPVSPAGRMQALHCLESKVSALDAQRRSYFKGPRRLAIAGGVAALALGVTTVALYFRSDPFDEYAEPSEREHRAVAVVGSLSIASAVAAFVGLGWRIVAGARGTPVDAEFRAAKRQRDLLRRELRLRAAQSALAVDFTLAF